MRKNSFVLALLLAAATIARAQTLVNHQILAGSGTDQPAAMTIDHQGFVYVAGITTSGDFPVTHALEAQLPQGGLEVSINGAPFTNSGLNVSGSADYNYRGVTAVTASSDGMLVIASANTGIYRSTDGGVTWEPPVNALPQVAALAVDPVNSSKAYAILQDGRFYRSTNGGVNWQATGTTLPPPASHNGFGQGQITIDPRNPATLYMCVDFAVYRSTNSGQSWQPLSIPFATGPNGQFPAWAFALAPSQPNVLYVAALSDVPGVALLKSTDGGSTWTTCASGISASFANGVEVDPTDPSIVWVASDRGLKKSTDGGATFHDITTPNGSGANSVVIDPANPKRVYVASWAAVSETSDGGATWSIVFSGSVQGIYAAPSRTYVFGGVPWTVFLAKLDPDLSQIIYSTYLWTGTVSGIAVDGQGNLALTGTSGGAGIVMKVSGDGRSLLYSTLLNGTQPNAVAMDDGGNAVIAGVATNLAGSKGAFQPAPPGPCPGPLPINGIDYPGFPPAFVAKLNAYGVLVYATYLAGSCGDSANGLALDASGAAYVAGTTYSRDFPVTQDAMTSLFPGIITSGFVAKLSPAGDQLLYSSFLGGGDLTSAHAVALDVAGNIFLAGSTQASPTPGASHAFSGGVGCPPTGIGIGPPLHPTPVGLNAFVMKMTPSASPAAFLATVGGSCMGEADSIALDTAGNIWLAGSNGSTDFATRAPIAGLGLGGGFLAELDPTASTVLSATETGYAGAVAANSAAVYYAGTLGSAALVAEIDPSQVAPISIDEIVPYSPLLPAERRVVSPVAPGGIVRILGRGIGPRNQAGASLTASGTLATSIGGVQVTFNGVPAPLVLVQASQIVCIVPFELDGLESAAAQVQYNGQISNAYTAAVVPQSPDVVAVVNADWSVNSPSNPAKAGSVVEVFLTGLGQTVPASHDGAINRPPLAQPRIVPAVTIQGSPANVAFIGAAAFEVAGASQINMSAPPSSLGAVTVMVGGAALTVYVAP